MTWRRSQLGRDLSAPLFLQYVLSRPRFITKTCLCNFDPLKPHFYIVKLGFTGVYIIFLISAQNIDCEYSLEPPRRGGSYECPQSMFWAEIWKKISVFFFSQNFLFLEVKFSVYLNRCVFVMCSFGYASDVIRRLRVRHPPRSATFFRGDLIMKYFLRSFSPFRWLKRSRCQFLAKEWTQYWLTA